MSEFYAYFGPRLNEFVVAVEDEVAKSATFSMFLGLSDAKKGKFTCSEWRWWLPNREGVHLTGR